MIYFKHHSNMRHDVKIKRVINKYGLEGYGLYNLIVESITDTLSTESPMPDLQETCEDIAEFYNGNTAKINEMANFMINQGLFDLDEMTGAILCHKVYKFLDTSQTRSEQLRNMIRAYKEGQDKALLDVSQTVTDGHKPSETNLIEKKRKEKEKKKEQKHKHGEYKHVLLTQKQYTDLKEKWGEKLLSERIKNMDEYLEMTGKSYKNHSLTMQKWASKDTVDFPEKPTMGFDANALDMLNGGQ